MLILTYNCKSSKYKTSISRFFLVVVALCAFIFFACSLSHLAKSFLCVFLIVLFKLFCVCFLYFVLLLLFLFALALFFYGRAPPLF